MGNMSINSAKKHIMKSWSTAMITEDDSPSDTRVVYNLSSLPVTGN